MDNALGTEPCGNGDCQVCDRIITTNTFLTKACGEVIKIQSGLLNCNSEKVLYFLRCAKFVMILPMLEKLKQTFVFSLVIINVNTDLFENENITYHKSAFIHTIFKIG